MALPRQPEDVPHGAQRLLVLQQERHSQFSEELEPGPVELLARPGQEQERFAAASGHRGRLPIQLRQAVAGALGQVQAAADHREVVVPQEGLQTFEIPGPIRPVQLLDVQRVAVEALLVEVAAQRLVGGGGGLGQVHSVALADIGEEAAITTRDGDDANAPGAGGTVQFPVSCGTRRALRRRGAGRTVRLPTPCGTRRLPGHAVRLRGCHGQGGDFQHLIQVVHGDDALLPEQPVPHGAGGGHVAGMGSDRAPAFLRSPEPQRDDDLLPFARQVQQPGHLLRTAHGLDDGDDDTGAGVLHRSPQVIGEARAHLVAGGDGVAKPQATVRGGVEEEVEQAGAAEHRAQRPHGEAFGERRRPQRGAAFEGQVAQGVGTAQRNAVLAHDAGQLRLIPAPRVIELAEARGHGERGADALGGAFLHGLDGAVPGYRNHRQIHVFGHLAHRRVARKIEELLVTRVDGVDALLREAEPEQVPHERRRVGSPLRRPDQRDAPGFQQCGQAVRGGGRIHGLPLRHFL